MTRVEAVPERKAGTSERLAYRFSRHRFGEVVDPLAVMAHYPMLLLGYGLLELTFERSHLVDEHLKSLAVLGAATMVGCEFCIVVGPALSRGVGVTEDQVRELPNYERSEVLSPL